MPLPFLVVVGGYDPATSTLARRLAEAIPCPAICRDEIKEGLVHGEEAYTPERGDSLNRRTAEVFFGVVRFLVEQGVSIVAEASFQHGLWESGLGPVLDSARVPIVRCPPDPDGAWKRMHERAEAAPSRLAIHGDPSLSEPFETFARRLESWEPPALPVPTLDVRLDDGGFVPAVDEIATFVRTS